MIVVSNTSPLINLFSAGQVELLHRLYGEVLIPQAVYQRSLFLVQDRRGHKRFSISNGLKSER